MRGFKRRGSFRRGRGRRSFRRGRAGRLRVRGVKIGYRM